MIQLTTKDPYPVTLLHLSTKQADVNSQAPFSAKADRANVLWNGKNGSAAGNTAFADVKNCLIKMSASIELCNYCETNEGTDIEHIYPKKLYPGSAFVWNNYLLACSRCNTHQKSDAFAIFNPAGSEIIYEISRSRGRYIQPDNNDCAFINQRIENPMTFFLLDVKGRTFHFGVHPGLTSIRDIEKAKYIRKLLGLNDRAELVEARRTAAQYYINRLEKYISVRDTTGFAALEAATADDEIVDDSQPFDDEKTKILSSIIQDIKTHRNPVVWQELVRQRGNLNKTRTLFLQVPEALTW